MQKYNMPYFLFNLLFCYSCINGAIIIPGDQADPSFSFPINSYHSAHNQSGTTFFIGSSTTTSNNFTVAKLNYMANQFMPLAPETITLNKVADSANPFRNKKISLLSSISKASAGIGQGEFAPLLVTDDDKKTIYLIDNIFSNGSVNVISNMAPIVDASGINETDGVIALTGATQGATFAAVLANGQSQFGIGDSGISLFGISDSIKVNDQDVKGPFLTQQAITAFNINSSFLTINSALSSINNAIDFHWDSRMNRLFVGLQATGSSGLNDGAIGVAVGRIVRTTDNVLIIAFQKIAPDAVFVGTDKIVGAIESSALINIYKVRTLHTSTTQSNKTALGLSYLIVQGDVNTISTTPKRSVYALPLVCAGNTETIGTLAKKDSTIINISTTQSHPMLESHCFNEPALIDTDAVTSADQSAIVGAGDTHGDIEDIYVIGDTVFVSISSADTGFKPGIFYSQAILNENNAIVAWTEWHPYNNVTESAFGFFTDNFAGQVQYLTGTDAANITTFKRSQWNTGSDTMSAELIQAIGAFSQDQGGIQGFKNFPNNTPGLSGTNGTVGIMITTGNNKIIIGQSGNNAHPDDTFCPTTNNVAGNTIFYPSSTIDIAPPANTKIVTFEGGELEQIGSIVATEIACDAIDNTRLFVGGTQGLAVLIDSIGNGWSGSAGLGNNFEGFTIGQAFKTVGNYTFIQKLIADANFLYVLTPQKLDRIDLQNSDFINNNLSITTVADIAVSPSYANGALSDVAISNKCALLATTFGLFRVGNGSNIATAGNSTDLNWTPVSMPFGVGPVVALQEVSISGVSIEFSSDNGNIYALTADIGNNRSRIYRFAIKDTSSSAIDDITILPLSDVYQNNVLQYFLNPGNLVQQFTYDGTLILLGMNRNLNINPMIYSPRTPHLPIDITQSSNIVSINKNSASGSRLVVTNNGIFTDE